MWRECNELLTAALPAGVTDLGWYAVADGVLKCDALPWVLVCWPGDMDKACASAKSISTRVAELREARDRERAEKAGKIRKRGAVNVRQEVMEL